MKKIISYALTAVLVAGFVLTPCSKAKADSTELMSYISFGADLRDNEKKTVMELLNVTEKDLEDYEVLSVTNEEEHKYLDEYLSKSVIGSRALSSVKVVKGEDGEGIGVTTKNITYCTSGMYCNALTTAGVTDADVVVAGPFNISGTAALVGAMKAYEIMTGEEISEENADAANNELVVQGKLGEAVGNDKATELIATVKDKVVSGNLSSSKDIKKAITDAEKEVGITLSEEQRQEVEDLMNKIKDLDIDPDSLREQAKDIYNKIADSVDLDSAKGFFEKIGEFFVDIGESIADFFSGLF